MSEFYLNAGAMKTDLVSLYGTKTELYLVRADLAVQILKLRLSGSSSVVSSLNSRLGKASKRIGNEITNINYIINSGNTICSKAKTAENAARFEMSGLSDIIKITWPFTGGLPSNVITSSNIVTELMIQGFNIAGCIVGNAISIFNDRTDTGFEGSLLGISGKGSKHTKVNGIDVGVDGEYSVLNIEGKKKASAEWDLEKGEVGAGLSGSIGISALKASGSANIGNTKISGEAKLVNAEAEGSVGISIFQKDKDGNTRFTPAIEAKVKGKASVAEGSVSVQKGTDEFNTHAKAEGTFLGAEAEAKLQVGRVVDEDTGKVKYGYSAKAGAEAYVAEGKVSGGFTIFGIKIDASIKGKAGGAGLTGSAEATTGGVEGEIGAGLGLGAGIKIKIDWTNFKAPKIKWPW